MKKVISMALSVMMIFTLAACGNNAAIDADKGSGQTSKSEVESSSTPKESTAPNEQQPSASESAGSDSQADAKTLVVYFSVPETTDPDNMTEEQENSTVVINGEVLGNTQYMAMVIAENTGADLFRIEPEAPYTTDHSALVDQAKKEQTDEARPAIAAQIENPDQYDTIFVGYPNWWGDMPMILYTFFDEYDFSGKTSFLLIPMAAVDFQIRSARLRTWSQVQMLMRMDYLSAEITFKMRKLTLLVGLTDLDSKSKETSLE